MSTDSDDTKDGHCEALDMKALVSHLSDELRAWREWAECRTGRKGHGDSGRELRDGIDRWLVELVGHDDGPEFSE